MSAPLTEKELRTAIEEIQSVLSGDAKYIHKDTVFNLATMLPDDEFAFLEDEMYCEITKDKPYDSRLKATVLECVEYGDEGKIVDILSEIFLTLSSNRYLWKILFALFRELDMRGSKWEWDRFFDEFEMQRRKK